MQNSLVSIIIVTYNNNEDIVQCIKSIINQSYTNYELIIVDNNSKDLTCKTIINYYDKIRLLELQNNIGFSGANNKGLKYANGRYIALLNPDTEVSPTWLETLVRILNTNKDVGICASKLLVYNSDVIDSAGDGCTTTGKGYKRGEGLSSGLYNKCEYVFGACGGAMLIRREVIIDIGFFDDDFFLIFEDTDFCFRAQLAGWKCLYVPEAVVYHKVRTSIGTMSNIAVYYSVRNSHFIWLKNMPNILLFKYLHQKLFQECVSFFYFVVMNKKYGPYFRATFSFFKELPVLLKKRKLIQNTIYINIMDLDKMLTSIWQKDFVEQKKRKLFS